mmetsp:Transcript_21544/g.24398  ORF Transcript_21544/g.24398 Transcript_21544/m.24398 type:complete len:402 (-) Transcript_21544:39-1244(-)
MRVLSLSVFLIVAAVTILAQSTFAAPQNEDDELFFVLETCRHGSRAPVKFAYKNPFGSHWPYGGAKLTPEGMRQHYKLGRKLRQRYIIDRPFLSPKFNYTEVHARSTQSERTILSAQAQLAGLFPYGPSFDEDKPDDIAPQFSDNSVDDLPIHFNAIPIYSTTKRNDGLLRPANYCKKFLHLDEQCLRGPRVQAYFDAKVTPYLPKISAFSGIKIDDLNLKNVPFIFDQLRCEIFEGHKIPEQVNESMMRVAADLLHLQLFSNPGCNPEAVKLGCSELFRDLAEKLEDSMTGESDLKFVLYSAHDVTVANFMNGLHVEVNTTIPYASNLIFELWKSSTTGEFYVKTLFNDTELDAAECGTVNCPVNKFIDFLINNSYEDIDDRCGKNFSIDRLSDSLFDMF